MKKYTKLYIKEFNCEDFFTDELLGIEAVDIHHICARGMGGTKIKDDIDFIMALSRECHVAFGDKKKYTQFLFDAHQHYLKFRSPYILDYPNLEAWDELKTYPKLYNLVLTIRRSYV